MVFLTLKPILLHALAVCPVPSSPTSSMRAQARRRQAGVLLPERADPYAEEMKRIAEEQKRVQPLKKEAREADKARQAAEKAALAEEMKRIAEEQKRVQPLKGGCQSR